MKRFISFLLVIIIILVNVYIFEPDMVEGWAVKIADCASDLLTPPEPVLSESDGELPASAQPEEKYVVVLDPGHGGSDPGAVSSATGQREADINLALARQLSELLHSSGRVKVYMTRGELAQDKSMTLAQRVEFAAKKKADLLIALHCNATFPDYTGSEVYVSGRCAQPCVQRARLLGENLLARLGQQGLNRRGLFFRMSQAGFVDSKKQAYDYYGVVRMATELDICSVLLEHCYLNEADSGFYSDDSAIEKLAQADARAILDFLEIPAQGTQVTVPELPGAGGGDANGDGAVDGGDVSLAVNALMCRADLPDSAGYSAADINGSGVLEVCDLIALKAIGEGGAPVLEDAGKTVRMTVSADTAKFSPGDTVTVSVQLGDWQKLSAAAGSIDYNPALFDFIGCDGETDGVELEEDGNYGLVRFCAPGGGVDGEIIELSFKLRMRGKSADERLSINVNCYSAASREGDVIKSFAPDCQSIYIDI